MAKIKTFKEFNKSLKEGLVDQNKLHIAKQTLLMSDHGEKLAAMTKKEAVAVLRDAGIPDQQIERLLIVGGALPKEISKAMA